MRPVAAHVGVDPCATVQCGLGQHCTVNEYGVAGCRCELWCPPVVTPVCGTDGTTYHSECHLQRHACVSQRVVSVAFVGACGSGVGCPTKKCPVGGVCRERYGRAECQCRECAGVYAPVCGTDARTYRSECHMWRVACLEGGSNVALQHEGPCGEYVAK
ncbi:hypothetical protein HAZT_HAZT010967 [Hyalella azteca]|uniref:Kazal-like domain-containing protein n=1 Tax=Hyalella azteca TaxID=294128 RepID=A0A6A0H534_HYAAZ|nr:hypothetical protein HAZT_HAZT010967 [Hyalella azteca]